MALAFLFLEYQNLTMNWYWIDAVCNGDVLRNMSAFKINLFPVENTMPSYEVNAKYLYLILILSPFNRK